MLIVPQISPADRAIERNIQALRADIAGAAAAAHRSDDCITVVAVSKGHAAERLRAAAALGLRNFGESYLQEALPKIDALRDLGLTWHFIGRIQSNKTAAIAAGFDWVHGIDRLKIAERLSAQRPHYAAPLQVCIQVKLPGDDAKAGVDPEAALQLAQSVHVLPRMTLRGLMCILPAGLGVAGNQQAFQAVAQLRERINRAGGAVLDTLSMGMSSDYREAIQQGATLLRIGSAIFGPRSGANLG